MEEREECSEFQRMRRYSSCLGKRKRKWARGIQCDFWVHDSFCAYNQEFQVGLTHHGVCFPPDTLSYDWYCHRVSRMGFNQDWGEYEEMRGVWGNERGQGHQIYIQKSDYDWQWDVSWKERKKVMKRAGNQCILSTNEEKKKKIVEIRAPGEVSWENKRW